MTKPGRKQTGVLNEQLLEASQHLVQIGQPDQFETRRLQQSGRMLAVSDLLWIPQAGLLAWALGSLLSSSEAFGQVANVGDTTVSTFLAALGVVLIAGIRVYLQNLALNKARETARGIQGRARGELLNAAVERSPALDFPSSGTFAAQVTDQVDLLGPYYRNYAPQLARLKLVPVGIVVATACFSWMAALILLVCGPLIPIFMALIGTKAKTASADQQEELTRLSGTLLDRIKGLETLVLFGALEKTEKEIQEAGERFRLGTMRVLKIAFLSSTVLELFSALGIAFCAVYVGFSLLGDIRIGTWGTPLGFPAGLFVLLLAPEFFAPLRAFAAAYHDRAAGLAAQEKLGAFLSSVQSSSRERGTEQREARRNIAVAPVNAFAAPPSIRFNNVSLSLSGHPVFTALNLEIQSGETAFLKGASGSGKTTLLDCVLGFHVPDSGQINVGEIPVQNIVSELRRNVVWLGQSPRLFHGSLRANVLKGASGAGAVCDEEIWTALTLAGADELVRRLPHGLATPIGEDGFGLSVGEIRRVALARAALRQKAPILLADEPTAGLDEETASDVIEGLRELASGRTAIIATHDPAVLELPGRLVDLGSTCTSAIPEVAV